MTKNATIKLPEGHVWKEVPNSGADTLFQCRCGATFSHDGIDGSTNFEESGYDNCSIYQFPIIFRDSRGFAMILEENDKFNLFTFESNQWVEGGELTFDEVDSMIGRSIEAGLEVFTKLNI